MTDIELTKLVNENGIFAVLDALSGICGRKAENDTANAADWEKAESAIDAAASKILDLFGND